MSSKTARITQEHLESPEFQGQAVRAVGKLLNVTDSQVQLQLAGGGEGGKASHSQRSRVPARSSLERVRIITAAPTTVFCPNGTHKYAMDAAGKGCYEVIGTLQNGTITEMQTVYMGENLGAQTPPDAPNDVTNCVISLLADSIPPCSKHKTSPCWCTGRHRFGHVCGDGRAHASVARAVLI